MGDVAATTIVDYSQPLVVSSTARKEVEKFNPGDQPSQSENTNDHDSIHPVPLASQNLAGDVSSQTQQHRQSVHSPHQDHGRSQNLDSQGQHLVPTENLQVHKIREMTDPSYSIPSSHPQFRYPSPGFQPSITGHSYQPQPAHVVTPLPNTVYYPYANSRYPSMYYSPFVPQYSPQTIPATQLAPPQGTYLYTPGYPHSYPPTPSVVSISPPNALRQQPQLPSLPARWAQGQHPVPQYVFMTNAFVSQGGPQPMQPSFSHPVQSMQQPPQNSSTAPGVQYVRRHSHPMRNPPTKSRASETEFLQVQHSGWAQGRAPGSQSTEAATIALNSIKNKQEASTTHTTSALTTLQNVPPYSTLRDGSFSMQVAEPPSSSLLTKVVSGTHPALPRGPPRKPRQSGHALWVGNLPHGTNVIELKDHFSHGATKEIESVFLISKSNCAFINYKTDVACNEAMTRFHDNRFKGVRLVCRLRRNSASPTSPPGAAANDDKQSTAEDTGIQGAQGGGHEKIKQIRDEVTTNIKKAESAGRAEMEGGAKDRIFILKSLTVEDLDLSVKNGVWATQSHNEEVLNRAFETSENVYLIFSANKSGEYYGYARMTSRIPEKDVDDNDGHTNSSTFGRVHRIGTGGGLPEALLPKSIFTPATSTAPEGRIIDDSARGTIFWEATEEDLVNGDAGGRENADRPEEADEPLGATKSWGKPFDVQWISTTKLPFYKTRGLRNSWNSNREVKIARDGTEVEESVGKRLLQMFHRGAGGNTPLPN